MPLPSARRKTKRVKQASVAYKFIDEEGGPPLHIRRCHLCDAVTEQTKEVVSRCSGCGKFMAPFYFFNEVEVTPYTDNALRPDPPTPDLLNDERLPLRGFTAFW